MAAAMPMSFARAADFRVGEHVAAELDGEAGNVDVLGELLDLLAGLGELLRGPVGEVDLGVRDLPVARDLPRALLGVGARDVDVGDLLLDLGEQLLHRLLDLGLVDPVAGSEHDLGLDLAVAEARLLEQVEGLLALGARELELGLERAADAAREHERGDEQDDPAEEHVPAAAVHRPRETLEHGANLPERGGSREFRRPSPIGPRSESHARYSRPVAYQSLYRKYRPQRFAELVGQEHVTTALQNAVRDGRVGHAYLFSGPRGTGKTTTARLVAKALNCTNRGDDGDPCGVCDSCVAIAEGSSLDVIEVDAASKSKVDDIRDLLERVAYLSAGGAKKVYILDEVHMLSTGAEAALLKTLEESPEHVVFVLATTDPLKVAPTIRSRTQHYEFTLYTVDELVGHLADVCAKEGVDADPEALAVIARAGAGSMRDSLSLLDQAIAHGRVDVEQVNALFGGTVFDGRIAILRAVADEDVAGALVALGELLDAGHEPRRLTEDLLATVRDAFLLTSARGRVRVDLPGDDQQAPRRARRAGRRADARAHARDARAGGRRHARHRRRRPASRARDRAGAAGPARGGHPAPGARRTRRPARAGNGTGRGAASPSRPDQPTLRRARTPVTVVRRAPPGARGRRSPPPDPELSLSEPGPEPSHRNRRLPSATSTSTT